MLPDLDQLLSEPEPSLVILDETYDSERSVRNRIEKDLRQLAFSTWDNNHDAHKEEMAIALQSLVFLTAQDISRRSSELQGTVYLRSEHVESAINNTTNFLLGHPVESVEAVAKWKSAANRFLRMQLQNESKREAVFRTCERFKIDTADFAKVFPKLPK